VAGGYPQTWNWDDLVLVGETASDILAGVTIGRCHPIVGRFSCGAKRASLQACVILYECLRISQGCHNGIGLEMKMLVLAGGFGTRLRDVVSDVPKPLAPVGSTPFLHYQVQHWVAQGVSSFIFLLHHQADLVDRFIEERRDGLLAGCTVQSITEPKPLDTGGAVAYAVRKIGLEGEFLVSNADTWLGSGVRELGSAGADAIIVVRQADVSRYGEVEVDGAGFVSAFREKSDSSGGGWINAGICALRAEHFTCWTGQSMSLEKDVFPKLLAARLLRAVPLESDFIDIGIPEDYLRFCRWQEGGREGRLCN
jgi:D-glycero-alpha-D-manno-heptose 1-phosphate guanylyltransferase